MPQLHHPRAGGIEVADQLAAAAVDDFDLYLESQLRGLEGEPAGPVAGTDPGQGPVVQPRVVHQVGQDLFAPPPAEGRPGCGHDVCRGRIELARQHLQALEHLLVGPALIVRVVAHDSTLRLESPVTSICQALARRRSRQRARQGPMLPTGIPSAALTSA